MKRVLAVVAGIVIGILLAGMLSPMAMSMLPLRLRAAPVLWAMMAAVVAASVTIFWWASGPPRD